MAEQKTIIGIDGASKKTGVAVIQNNKLVQYGILDYHNVKDPEQRVTNMTIGITDILSRYSPAIIWMEDTWTSANPRVSQMLTTILGGVRYWATTHDCEFHSILPSSWRKELNMNEHGAKRQELKKKSIDYIKEHFDIKVSDDISDAICIAIVGNIYKEKSE